MMLVNETLYHFWGMHMIWWFFWFFMVIWIFATPYSIPFEYRKKDAPLEILKRRFAGGAITVDEYHQHKKILENDLMK
jgi:putative membrane protein